MGEATCQHCLWGNHAVLLLLYGMQEMVWNTQLSDYSVW